MWKTIVNGRARLFTGDCRDALEELPSNSVDAISTDPPYALVSVTKRFGKEGSAPAKHGTDGLYARASAGFMGEKWDTGEVAFAAEFWKQCLRVLKPGGYLVAMGGTRTYHRLACAIEDSGFEVRDMIQWLYGTGFPKSHNEGEGRGTALKPANEPICLARKPLSEKTIAANLTRWGTGALWIDRSRVPTDEAIHTSRNVSLGSSGSGVFGAGDKAAVFDGHEGGRWPANVVTDGSEEVLAAFPFTKSGTGNKNTGNRDNGVTLGNGFGKGNGEGIGGDEGSAARFFYGAKASATDREEGTTHLPVPDGQKRANFHPTVKPTPLTRWLNGLICPPGGVILDPFMGSGSTGKAAMMDGFRFIGCEMTEKYAPIAEARVSFGAGIDLSKAADDY